MLVFEFFRRQLPVSQIYGIPVKIEYSWFIILGLMSYVVGINIPSEVAEDLLVKLGLGLATTLVLFASILIHELAHSYMARSEGIEVMEIILHPFGGLAKFRKLPDNPGSEFKIAAAGPFASFLLGFIFGGAALAFSYWELPVFAYILGYLTLLNLLIAIFNLFPGYPLDGGRVLRAFLWKRGYDLNQATILTGRCGQVISVAMILIGGFIALVKGDFLTGFWTALVGIYLLASAIEIIKEVGFFDNLLAAEAMEMCVPLSPEVKVAEFVDRVLPLYRQVAFLVSHQKQFYGVLTLADLKELPKEKWHTTTIKDVMRPVVPDYFVETTAPINEARDLMRLNGIGALGVIDEKGNLVGYLQRGRVRKRN